MKIKKISAIEILDSRGNPTVEAHVFTESGIHASAKVPSGASTGKYEAIELRDKSERFHGKGVLNAVKNINTCINNALISTSILDQQKIDDILCKTDGSMDKHNLGSNSILAVSMACLKAAAQFSKLELFQYIGGINAKLLPLPMMNIINGGMHAKNNLDIQEFMIVPVGATCFSEGLRMCTEVYHTLKKNLIKQNKSTAVGDEGGFAPFFEDHESAIDEILYAIESTGYKVGKDVKIALDAAASEWFNGINYKMPKSGNIYTKDALVAYWQHLVNKYPIISIEDPASEDDWGTWNNLMSSLKIQIVGDDLFATNSKRLLQGINLKAANSILIKPNQIGTVSETLHTLNTAKASGFGTIISHRSGDTEDSFIADLAVGLNAGQIKTGAPCRSERNAKYNRLLYIESLLAGKI